MHEPTLREALLVEQVRVTDDDDVTLASRSGLIAASTLGARGTSTSRLDLVVRELAWNLVRHAGGGTLRLTGLREHSRQGLMVESVDQGGGIASPVGPRTRAGLGFGLGAIQRNSNEFTMHSSPMRGTTIRAVIWWPSTSS